MLTGTVTESLAPLWMGRASGVAAPEPGGSDPVRRPNAASANASTSASTVSMPRWVPATGIPVGGRSAICVPSSSVM